MPMLPAGFAIARRSSLSESPISPRSLGPQTRKAARCRTASHFCAGCIRGLDDGLHGRHIGAQDRADLFDRVVANFGVHAHQLAVGDRVVLELEAFADHVRLDLEHELTEEWTTG